MNYNQEKFINSKKIVVIGNAGGGKSTLCRLLSKKLNIPIYHIDHIQWKPGWVRVPINEYAEKHTKIVEKDKWIIDGFGPWEYIEERFNKADIVIYVDLPILIHLYWATKRQLKCLFRPRIDGPPGCPMLPVTFKLYKMIWYIHKTLRPRLQSLINKLSPSKIITIKKAKEIKELVTLINST